MEAVLGCVSRAITNQDEGDDRAIEITECTSLVIVMSVLNFDKTH